jgi:hypothetical protein
MYNQNHAIMDVFPSSRMLLLMFSMTFADVEEAGPE